MAVAPPAMAALSRPAAALHPTPATKPERVLTITDFHDGPRCGIALFNGAAHSYHAVFDVDLDDYSDIFMLSPINDALLALALEDWAIWLRWRAAFQQHLTPLASHPALDPDRLRHQQLKQLIGQRLMATDDTAPRRRAGFSQCGACDDWSLASVVWQAV